MRKFLKMFPIAALLCAILCVPAFAVQSEVTITYVTEHDTVADASTYILEHSSQWKWNAIADVFGEELEFVTPNPECLPFDTIGNCYRGGSGDGEHGYSYLLRNANTGKWYLIEASWPKFKIWVNGDDTVKIYAQEPVTIGCYSFDPYDPDTPGETSWFHLSEEAIGGNSMYLFDVNGTLMFHKFAYSPDSDWQILWASEDARHYGDNTISNEFLDYFERTPLSQDCFVLTSSDIPALEADGYIFEGWYNENGERVYEGTPIFEDITLTAVWTKVDVPPSVVVPSITITDLVTDTGSALSSTLDMASVAADTVTQHPVLLLGFLLPVLGFAVILLRRFRY